MTYTAQKRKKSVMENFIFCAVIPLHELIETNGRNFTYISTSFNIKHLKSQYQVITAHKEQGTNNYRYSALYSSCTPSKALLQKNLILLSQKYHSLFNLIKKL